MGSLRKRFELEYYVDNILKGDRVVLSRAITIIESSNPADEALAAEILNKLLPFTGKSIRIGLTGSPGVGKSTFIEAFGEEILKGDHKIAVLTIDPSSSKTKGSILGDKTRMSILSKKENVFIRPSPAGESLGGVSAKTREAMLLCEAAGFHIIIIETVGVGQSETHVKSMVDLFLLLMLAGGGDELQGIKRGIMELADFVAITKADGDNQERALKARQDYQNALHVLKSKNEESAEVLVCSSLTGFNISLIWEKIKLNIENKNRSGIFKENRSKQNLDWLHEIIRIKIGQAFYFNNIISKLIKETETDVLLGKIDVTFAAKKLLDQFWISIIRAQNDVKL